MNKQIHTDSGAATFHQDAVEASHGQLVLVDFWASWCGPCRSLGPILEKLAAEYQGSMKLVKVDTDREQGLAGQFGIRSLPTVLFLKEGKIVDQFMGMLPETAIRKKIDQHAVSPLESSLEEARMLYEKGERESARKILSLLIESMPDRDDAKLQLLTWLVSEGSLEEAAAVAETLSPEGRDSPEYRSFQVAQEFREDDGDVDRTTLESAIAHDPTDLDARYRLARRLISEKEFAPAMDHLLEIIRQDRSYMDDGARRTMLKVFEMLGGRGELVSEYRTRLSRTLF